MTSPTGDIIRSLRRGNSPAKAFSLIELILVMLLLSLAASMVSPMLGRFSRGRSASDAALHMLAIMQYAQEQAAMTSTIYRLNFDAQAGTYWLSTAPRGVDTRIASEIGRTFTLPEYITLQVDGSEQMQTNHYIQFDTDGGHDMAVIRLTDSQDKQIIIACPSPSETYRIGDPADLREQGSW